MIPLLPLLVLAPQGHSAFAKPEWLAALLHDAPRSLRMPAPSLQPRPGGGFELPPNAVFVGVSDNVGYPPGFGSGAATSPPNAKSDPWKVLQDRASALIDGGHYEEAYRIERAGHEGLDEDELLDYDRLPDAALLTGRYAEAQRLLVQAARLGPGSEVPDGELLLSLASAAQGRAYPGQGAWVLDELRESLSVDRATLAAGYKAPTDAAGVAALSVLALGLTRRPAYLEWALRLDSRCMLAGTALVQEYAVRHRPADAARVAAAMVKALPPGKARDGFAARLKALKGSPESALTGKGAKVP